MKNSNLPETQPEVVIPGMLSSPLNSGVIRTPASTFVSNPVELLPERVVVEWPLDAHGDPQRKLVIKNPNNRSVLDGLVFDRSMTLSGMIADGVSLSEVSPIDLRSKDPNDVSRRIESDVIAVMDSYTSAPVLVESQPEPESVVINTPVESVNE